MACCCKQFIYRALIYQLVIFMAVNQLMNLKSSQMRFKDRVVEISNNLINMDDEMPYVKEVKMFVDRNPKFELYYKYGLIAMAVCGALSIICNCFLTKLASSLLFLIAISVTYNPLLRENKIHCDNTYGIRRELCLCVVLFVGMFMMVFKRSCKAPEPKKDEKAQNETEKSKKAVKPEEQSIEMETKTKKNKKRS